MGAKAKAARLRGKTTERVEKRTGRKRALAADAISTLAQLGYAHTSLRDIARKSGVSVGVLHYYFEDKVELISYCVRQYKEDFVARLDRGIETAPSPLSLVDGFVDGLVETIEAEASTHRLWYDIKTQALFDDSFRPVVDEIEQALISVVEKLMTRLGIFHVSPFTAYLWFDGLFWHCLRRRLVGDANALAAFRERLIDVFASMGATPSPPVERGK